MVSLKFNALTMFTMVILQYQHVRTQTLAAYREFCIHEIKLFFHLMTIDEKDIHLYDKIKGRLIIENIHENAKHAILNYNQRTKMNFIAKSYFNSFLMYLRSDFIRRPTEFCATYIIKDQCESLIIKYFSENPLQSLYKAFYLYDHNTIQKTLGIVKDYWLEITNKFFVESVPGLMLDPIEYCSQYYAEIRDEDLEVEDVKPFRS